MAPSQLSVSTQNYHVSLAGVINVTPDSFSDPGLHQSAAQISHTLSHFRSHQVQILDIGAESTAPMNSAVGESGEWARLEDYFFASPHLEEFLSFEISLDSFRPKTVAAFAQKLRELGYQKRLIWNDVSGVLSEEVFELIKRWDMTYVYCHNEVKSRDDIFSHAKLRGDGPIFDRVLSDALRVKELFHARNLLAKLVFDPCFGFSKSAGENYELMSQIKELISSSELNMMIGVSRKSFLRSLVQDGSNLSREELNAKTDSLQSIYFSNLLSQLDKLTSKVEIMLRLHEPSSFTLSKQSQIFLK